MLNQSNRRLFYLIIICKSFLNEKILIIIIFDTLGFVIQLTKAVTFKCVKDGFFPDKKDCWIYHICVGTMHSVKACKEDLLFNPIKNECDWAMNVNENYKDLFLTKKEFLSG